MEDVLIIKPNANVLGDSLDSPVQVLVTLTSICSFSISLVPTPMRQSDATVPSHNHPESLNISSIIAVILGGMLLALIIGLIVFICWKRKRNRKKRFYTFSPSTSSTIPVITPPLYDISASRKTSYASNAPPVVYHIYEDLP